MSVNHNVWNCLQSKSTSIYVISNKKDDELSVSFNTYEEIYNLSFKETVYIYTYICIRFMIMSMVWYHTFSHVFHLFQYVAV